MSKRIREIAGSGEAWLKLILAFGQDEAQVFVKRVNEEEGYADQVVRVVRDLEKRGMPTHSHDEGAQEFLAAPMGPYLYEIPDRFDVPLD